MSSSSASSPPVTTTSPPATAMLPYDRNALTEIERWRNEQPGFFDKLADKINKPIEAFAEHALDNAAGEALAAIVRVLMGLLNDGASWSVREDAIWQEFQERGFAHVKGHADLKRLPLEELDRAVGMLDTKYKAIALAEGASAGALGAATIAISIPALVGIALRAVAEYATYYGYDVAIQGERAFALRILSAASAPTTKARKEALDEIAHLTRIVASQHAVDEVNKLLGAQAMKTLAEALGLRLTKAKLAQIVPLAGALVGGGYNAWYLGSVTEAAYHLYRERFLIDRYGDAETLAEVDKPA